MEGDVYVSSLLSLDRLLFCQGLGVQSATYAGAYLHACLWIFNRAGNISCSITQVRSAALISISHQGSP